MYFKHTDPIDFDGISHQPHFSTRVNDHQVQSKHRRDPNPAELPLPPAAEDSQGAAVAAIQVGRVCRWGQQSHPVALFCCGNTRNKAASRQGRTLNSSPYSHTPIQHMDWQIFLVISPPHIFVKRIFPTETASLCRHVRFQAARGIIHIQRMLINQV